jgi:hypothetical protein
MFNMYCVYIYIKLYLDPKLDVLIIISVLSKLTFVRRVGARTVEPMHKNMQFNN